MVERGLWWLAGLMVLASLVQFVGWGNASMRVWLPLAGGLGLAFVLTLVYMRRWRPTSRDPEADVARSRLEWVWRGSYGGGGAR